MDDLQKTLILKKHPLAWAFSLFALIWVFRIILVSYFGVDVPYFDQWDMEGEKLYIPYLEGHFSFWDIFKPHNEHPIAMTRIYLLTLFNLNGGVWDSVLSMKVQAGFLAATGLFFIYDYIRKFERPSPLSVFILFLVFFLPIGYDSLLWGIEVHWYFLTLFSMLSLQMAAYSEAPKKNFFFAYLLSILSFLSIASGFITTFVVGIMEGYRFVKNRDRYLHLIFSVVCLVTTFLLYKTIPKVAVSEPLALESWSRFPYLFLKTIGWPDMTGIFFYWLPSAYVIYKAFRQRLDGSAILFPLGIICWLLIQGAAVTVKRGGFVIRYADMFMMIIPVTIYLVDLWGGPRLQKWLKPLIVVLLLTITFHYTPGDIATEYRERKIYKQTIVEAVFAEKITPGEGLVRLKKGPLPHVDAELVDRVLKHPKIKEILPQDYK
ncbi:MAG: hypothetical protein KDD61_01470 [Bdellovibrionales bacterium]|nr:hypothetical protein [Bdellovibrionales bacterium]